MIGPISGSHAKEQDSRSQEQEIVLIELQPRPRWPRYTFVLVLVGILSAAVFAYVKLQPVSIAELASPVHAQYCEETVGTRGIVTTVYDEKPGFEEIYGDWRGYWLKDTNELGVEAEIAVFYDPARTSAPALGQSLKVAGVLECPGVFSPENAILEQYRRVE